MQPSFEDFRAAEQDGLIADSWPEVVPFDAPVEDAGDFPLNLLPAPLGAFCEAVSDALQVPGGMVGPLALGCLSTLYQGRYSILGNPGWEEPLNLYVLVSARPSERKTPTFNALQAPFRTWETERAIEDKTAVEQSRSKLRILEAQQKTAEAGAAKKRGQEAERDREDALALAAEIADFEPVYQRRLFADDSTEEAMGRLMFEQGGVLTLSSDEGGFLTSFTRYKTVPDLDLILKAYPGTPVTVDRIGRSPIRIESPRLTVTLCCQPETLRTFLSDSLFVGRGLTARFLYSEPKTLTGRRTFTSSPVPGDVRAAYDRFVRYALDDDRTGLIQLSARATEVLKEVFDDVELKFLDEDIPPATEAWLGKYCGNLLRVCGLLHAAEASDPVAVPVPQTTMIRAATIMDFFRTEFERLNNGVNASPLERDCKYILRRLAGSAGISRRDLHRKCRSRFKFAVDLDGPLRELEDRGYIRIEHIQTAGRPSESIRVNPELGGRGQYSQK